LSVSLAAHESHGVKVARQERSLRNERDASVDTASRSATRGGRAQARHKAATFVAWRR
jgi:hypothetical protein